MREIKFRIWDKDADDPQGRKLKGVMICWEYALDSSYFQNALKGNYLLMQFTGLKDKNVKDLDWWDRDIIQSFHFKEAGGKMHYLFHVIVWSDVRGMWLAINIENYKNKDYSLTQNGNMMLYVYYKSAMKPVKKGNIYENPELLS